MRFNRHAIKAIPLAGLGLAVAAALSGCGGPTSGGAIGVATPDSGPVIYGLNAQGLINGTQGETSGLGYTSDGTQIGVLTGATGYKTDSGPGPLPVYQSNYSTGIPLGFPNTAAFVTGPVGQALPTSAGGAVVFRTYISTGAKGGNPVDLNTSSVVLTSSEAPDFSQPLSFDKAGLGEGPLGQGQYTTATFALPTALTTTGLHNLHTVVSDVAGQKSETDFSFLALAPTDSAAYIAIFAQDANGKFTVPVPGATATITNPLPNVAAYKDPNAPATLNLPLTTSYSDAQGVAILFAPPGTQTVTITAPDPNSATGTVTGTVTVKLTAGVADTADIVNATPVVAAKAINASRSRHL